MIIQKLVCECGKCQREFFGEIVVQCPVDLALASMKLLRCPGCGTKKKINILFGERYREAFARLNMTEEHEPEQKER